MVLDIEEGIVFKQQYNTTEEFVNGDELKEVFNGFAEVVFKNPLFLLMGNINYDLFKDWMARHIRDKFGNEELVDLETVLDAWWEFEQGYGDNEMFSE